MAELDKTALEYSTVKRGDSQGKGRPRRERLFRGGVDGSGTVGRKCGSFQGKPVKPKMKNWKDMTLDEVKAELIRRAKKEHDHERHVQNVEQQKAIAMAVQSTLDKYNTTPEMCDEVLAAASAGLPLNVTDNRHFRTCLAKVAACGTKFLRGCDDAHLSHSYTCRLWFKDGPLAGQAVVPWDLERERETFRSLVKAATDEEDDSN